MLKYSRAGLEKKRPNIPKYSEFCSFTELCSDKILKIEVRQIEVASSDKCIISEATHF
jgi:hypothetical protein